ncbi:TolB family protein [Micromonospora auratinigra]|uniref:WD40-like Beta Propeller Repeat n=1 Tax=Micromonospora auratinigra TaxID=261654 RepID=A0A1A9A0I9_9ACTN|nr:PD40 domain-containing protein [Micromonospora auratinigra]SBT49710.1 WD40-like Beta Propeller Repeat [Micromonospora auratinigra]
MSSGLDETLRAAVHELADEVGPAADLAGRAIGRGRRLRRRRRATVALGTLAAVVAVVLPFALLRPQPAARPTAPTTPAATASPTRLATPGANWTAGPLVLPGGWVVTRAQAKGGSGSGFLLDRARGRYVATDRYDGIYPAPTGSLVAVRDEARPRQVGLIDVSSGATHWYEVGRALSVPRWSPDGRRLLFTTYQLDHFGFIVMGTDGTRKTHRMTGYAGCSDYCDFTWSRDGREVVLPQTGGEHDEARRDARRGVQLFSADDGRPTRLVPIPGDPSGPWAWSPDGKLVVVQGREEPLLVETATGRTVNPLPSAEAVWVSDDRLLYRRPLGQGDFTLADPTGRELVRQPLPKELISLEVLIAPR